MDQPIMVIDDSLTVRKILEASLQRAGFAVFSFPDGLQALHALHARQVLTPDAVILDIGLPQMDGYTVARALKQRYASNPIPILLLSGYTSHLDKLRGRLAGASAYVTKPFQPAQVIAVLRAQLADRMPATRGTRKTLRHMTSFGR